MLSLRRAHNLARLVLAWFVLSLGVALAAPLVSPQSMEMVCSASGSKLVVHTDQGAVEMNAAQMHCPMCLPAGAPPPMAMPALGALRLPSFALPAAPAHHVSQHVALPWQARAPPHLS